MNEDQEYQALNRSICETPADDAPRLILSDWLEEHDEDAWAEFIRLQLASPEYSTIYDGADGQCKAGTLLHKFGHQWLGEWYGDNGRGIGRKWVWNRGFISEVRLTCAEFCGGPCERCDRRGVVVTTISAGIFAECDKCSGTGRIEGVARALFERHPITAVRLTDKKPESMNNWHFAWWEIAYGKYQIPSELVNRLRSSLYTSEAAALAALSDACVAYGRELVGLPALTPA